MKEHYTQNFSRQRIQIALLLFLFVTLGVHSQTTTVTYNNGSGNFNVAGVTAITVEAWGGGGAGGGSTSSNNGGSGGGGGGYVYGADIPVTMPVPYTVGAGGTGSTGNGTAGGNTTIAGLTAYGGTGGRSNRGTAGAGGAAAGGTINLTGSTGAVGSTSSGGNGGSAPNGGAGGLGSTNAAGQAGSAPGGGGGGGERSFFNQTGGAGGAGRIVITYVTPPTINNISGCYSVGSTFTITGTNFSLGGSHPIVSVTVNGIAATFTINSNTSITATVPAGATSGPVRISKNGAFAQTSTNINIAPIVPNTSGPATVCLGGSATLSNAMGGGVWSSSNPAVATVSPAGVVTGVSLGTVNIIYTVTVGGCSTPQPHAITVMNGPAVSGPSFACAGQTGIVYSAPGTGTWTSSNPSVATIDNSGNVTPLATGTTTFTFVDSVTNCWSTSDVFEVVEAPVISAITSSLDVCRGDSASFSVTASGGGLSYQWYHNGTPLTDSATVSGSNTANLDISSTTFTDAGTYYAEVSNACGSDASIPSVLNILETPTVGNYVLTNCAGTPFSLTPVDGSPAGTVVPVGTTYSWGVPFAPAGLTGGSAASGETSFFGTLINTTPDVLSAFYTVTPLAGSCPAAPFTVEVQVSPVPSIVNYSIDACSGVTFTTAPVHGGANVVPTDVTYSWPAPSVTGGMTGGTAMSGQVSIAQTLVNPTGTIQTATYTITASNGCGNVTFTLLVSVAPQPTVAGAPATQTVCSGTALSTISISNPNAIPGFITYTWTRDNTALVTGMPASGVGQTIDGTLVNTTGVSQVVNFSLFALSENGCESIPTVVSVTVDPVPVPVATPMTQTVCAGTGTSIAFSTSNSLPGVVFSWTRDNPTVGGVPMSGTGDVVTSLLTNSTSFPQLVTFTVTATLGDCSSTINNVTLTINPQPSVAVVPDTQTVCGGTPISTIVITNPNNITGTTYAWVRDNTTNVTGIAASGTSQTIAGTLVNVTNVPQTVTFTINATAGGCPSFNTTVTVIVNPAPIMTASPASQNICSGASMSLTFNNTNSVPGTTYSWVRTNTSNITGVAGSGTGNVISGTLTNHTSSTQTTTFTITATAPNGCTQVQTATVSVYPPVVAPVIGANQVVCVNQTPTPIVMTTVPSGGPGAYTYQWQSSTSGNPGTWTNISGATGATYQPPQTNSLTPQIFYQLVVTACGTQYTSNTISVVVANNQNFSFDIEGGSGTFCPGATFSPYIGSLNAPWVRLRYAYTADGNYVTPAIGSPVGGYTNLFLVALSYATLNMTVENNTNATVTTNVYLTPWVYNNSTGQFICTLSPEVLTISIRPRAKATVLSQPSEPICSNTSANIVVDGNITDAAMNFTWTRIDGNSNVVSTQGTGSVTGLTHPANSFTIPDVLTNNSASVQTVTYQITPVHASCTSLPGTPITVSVQVAPNLQPGTIGSNHSVCFFGDPNTLTEITPAIGVNLTYQWESAPTAAGPWLPISGATGPTYNPPFGLMTTTYYRRVVTSTVGATVCSIANTVPVVVTVNNMTPGVIGNHQTVCENQIPSPITSTTAATGTGTLSYMWQSSPNAFGPWTNMGVTSATLTFAAPLANTTYFKRITTSTHGGSACEDETNIVTITVNHVTAGTIGDDQVLCGGSNNPSLLQQITPATGSGTLSYQWQISTAADCNSGWANIPGVAAQGANYDPPAGVVVTTRYRRITTSTLNGVACSAISNCVTVTANPVTGGAIAGNRTVCMGGDPAAFTEVVASTGPNLSYQWQMSTVSGAGPWTDIPLATGPTYDAPGPITQTTYFQRVTFSTVGSDTCQAVSNFVTVFVNDVTPATYSVGGNVCAGENPSAFTIATSATGLGSISYQWYSSTVGCAGPWTLIPGATSATYDPSAITQTTYYQVVTTSTLNGVSCSQTSACVTLTFGGKTWNGSVSQDWNNPANWTPAGVPTSANCVVIPDVTTDPVISGAGYEAFARSVLVLNGGNLQVSEGTIEVTDAVSVNAGGTFHIASDASLVQVNNVANVGIVTVDRTTTPMYRFDYTYWNTPMQQGSYTLGNLSPNTQPDKYYSWNPSVGGGVGNWVQESAATVMSPLKGYIVRAPNSFSFTPTVFTPYTATFSGTPNNGDVNVPISVGTLGAGTSDDKLNLIGNPYPSAINADWLLNDPHNSTVVEGTLYFWTHHAPPSAAYPNPFYGTFELNYSPDGYASYNATGSTGTVPSGMATSPAGYGQLPNGYIASGQSFFAIGKQNGTLNFTNAMRVRGNNDNFFRPAQGDLERHRIWLNFGNQQGLFSQSLVGYVADATNGIDSRFDGPMMSGSFALYSIAESTQLGIQGRALPFVPTDQVPLGIMTPSAGTFSIGIDHVDGLFDHQAIYLEDKLTSVIHDLKASEYTFSTAAGTFENRFVLRYDTVQLGTDQPLGPGQYVAFIADGHLHVSAGSTIRSIRVYDMAGKLIKTYKPEEQLNRFMGEFRFAQGMYIAKITLDGGEVISAKLAN